MLTDWIVSAAARRRLSGAITSIPGVAQRTGATTYYIEILPVRAETLGGKRPVLALTPGVGDIDIAVASELLEAGRTVANGFVTPDRTPMIASTQPLLCDGRKDRDGRRPLRPGQADARPSTSTRATRCCIDMAELAKQSGSIINAVMLGAIAGCGRLPLTPEQLRGGDPRRRQSGRQQSARLPRRPRRRARSDAAGDAAGQSKSAAGNARRARTRSRALSRTRASHRSRRRAPARGLSRPRLCAALSRPAQGDREADETSGAQGRLLREIARHLAVRMSYEDVMRVAQAKIAPERMRRIAQDELRVTGEPFTRARFPQARHRGTVPVAAAGAGAPDLALLRAQRLARPRLFRHGDQRDLDHAAICASCCSPSCGACGLTAIATPKSKQQIEVLARPDRRGGTALARSCARDRRMRAADQGLWRHLRARHRQLPRHRGAR